MKNSTIVKLTAALAIIFLGYANSWGQSSPASITDGTSTLRQFGVNSAGAKVATEYVDSLTVGATNVKYLVYPDSAISPSYNFATSPTLNLNSHFVWSSSATVTIDTVNAGYASNYALITFPNTTGDHTLSVYEKANAGSCTASARSYTIRLIAAPNVTATSFSTLGCPTGVPPYSVSGPTATLTLSTAVSGEKNVIVTYNLTGPTGFTALSNQSATLGNGKTIDLSGVTLTQPGTYTLRILTISDRISQKSGLATTVNTDYTFILNRTPVTGPIYHLPNM